MDYKYAVLTGNPERLNVITCKLGQAAGEKYTTKDAKKVMKMGPVGNFFLAPTGSELEGFLDNVDGGPPMGGFPAGGVARPGQGIRVLAQVAAAQATPLVFGDLVVAGVQLALGIEGLPQVIKGAPATFKYQVITVNGTGGAGSTVVLERL